MPSKHIFNMVEFARDSCSSIVFSRKDTEVILQIPNLMEYNFLYTLNQFLVPHFTTNTGQCEYVTRSLETLPSSILLNPVIPLLPTTIMSALLSSAYSTISLTTDLIPTIISVLTLNFFPSACCFTFSTYAYLSSICFLVTSCCLSGLGEMAA